MPYHRLVQRLLRTGYQRVNQGDPAFVLRFLAPDVRYQYHGDSPLAGVRRSKQELEEFLAGLAGHFPGLRFVVEDVVVGGWPRHTTVIAWLTLHVPLPNRPMLQSPVAQRVTLRWGRITSIETLSDSKKVDEAFAALATA